MVRRAGCGRDVRGLLTNLMVPPICVFGFLLIASLLLIGWTMRGLGEHGDSMYPRVLCIAGGGMVLLGCIFLPWVAFVPLVYVELDFGADFFLEYAPGVATWLLRFIGQRGLGVVFSLVQRFGSIPAWLLVLLMPTTSIWVRVVILLVGLTGSLSIVWFLASLFSHNESIQRVLTGTQAFSAFLAAFLLLFQMPTIDAWGSTGTFLPGLLVIATGARMGSGVWAAWLGLLILGVGSLLTLGTGATADRALRGDGAADDGWLL